MAPVSVSAPAGAGSGSVSEFEQGAIVWVSDPEAVWLSGKVTQSSAAGLTVTLDLAEDEAPGDERTVTVPAGGAGAVRVLRRNVTLLGDGALRFDDLTEVPELHEAAVLQALDVRFAHGRIYTLTGPVLLAVNPFRTLPGIYSPEVLRSFVGSDKLQPHIFSVANHAYQGILKRQQSQTVLVSGESGAGKTETTKFVMQFLALAGAEAVISETGKPLSRVEKQVLRSNPLLEAFGNAKTLRNENSSRFGKYIELQFGTDEASHTETSTKLHARGHKRLVGTRIRTYLLEKVRVTDQQDGERSFHIFYQALAGAAAASLDGARDEAADTSLPDLSALAGCSPASFAYLRNTAGVTLEQADDAQDFNATLAAMRTVGFSAAEVADVLRALAAVLHLGDVVFAVPKRNSEASEVVTADLGAENPGPPAPFQTVARMLGVQEKDLHDVLCMRTMQAPGEGIIRMANTVKQAVESRDALARHLYHAIFNHIVEKTNCSIGFREEALFCGVLDIFGFEFFKTNSFEQLCINFTNELLQRYFNTFIFEMETELYREEGIAWEPLDFPDNGTIVALLSQNPSGVFPMLDEECFVVGGSSSTWHTKLLRTHDKHSHFSFVRHVQNTFVVQHFAGPVTYSSEGFVEKNKDRLTADLIRCLSSSEWLFLRELFSERVKSAKSQGDLNSGGSRVSSKDSTGQPLVSRNNTSKDSNLQPLISRTSSSKVLRAQRLTVSSEFRQQLQELMSQIRTTAPHFVRCIKPNPQNRPFVDASEPEPKPLLERRSVAEQLRYQGVLEAIRVARAGYPVRFLHADFFADFRCLLDRGPFRDELEAKLAEAGGASEAGASEVRELLRAPEVSSLLPAPERSNGSEEWAIGRSRVFLKQRPFGALRAAQARVRQTGATRLQAAWRGRQARRTAVTRRRALIFLQARFRGYAARKRAAWWRRERAATILEAACRTLLATSRLRRANHAVSAAQRWARMRPCRKRYVACLVSIVRLQAWWRGWMRRLRMRNLPKSVLHIQRCWRGHLGRNRAKDQLVANLRLRRAMRRLIRIRRKNLSYRQWRARILDLYRGKDKRKPQPVQEQLLQSYVALEGEHTRREAEVRRLRAELQRLQWKVQQHKSGGVFAHFGRFCM